jgi:hypothetical protein
MAALESATVPATDHCVVFLILPEAVTGRFLSFLALAPLACGDIRPHFQK